MFIAEVVERLHWAATGRKGAKPPSAVANQPHRKPSQGPPGQRHRAPGRRESGVGHPSGLKGRIADDPVLLRTFDLWMRRSEMSDAEFVAALAERLLTSKDAVRRRLLRSGVKWKRADILTGN